MHSPSAHAQRSDASARFAPDFGRSKGSLAKNVLVVDDDLELCELLDDFLTPHGLRVTTATSLDQGYEQLMRQSYDILILDVSLPDGDGFEMLRRVREPETAKTTREMPVLMLTGRTEAVDRILGLELGADDYLAKPFIPRELVARIRAILRRCGLEAGVEEGKDCRYGEHDIIVDLETRQAWLGDDELELTTLEFNILAVLVREAGNVVSRDLIAREAMGRELAPFERSLDVHVSNIRRKLGISRSGTERIKTVRGVGYLFTKAKAAPGTAHGSPDDLTARRSAC